MKKLLTAVLLAQLLSGCASNSTTTPKGVYSAGGAYMIQTKISDERTLKAYAEAQQKNALLNDISTQKSNPLLDGDLLFGSGLVGSTVFFAQNGVWLNPGNFLDKASLGMFAFNVLSGIGMSKHPWTYTYFFHQSAECNERKCVEDNFEAFSRDMMREYFQHPAAKFKESDVISIDYSRSNMFLDRFGVFVQFNNPEAKHNAPWKILSAINLKRMYQSPIPTWGNVEPTKFQDMVGLPGLSYEQTAAILLKISAAHPNILTYIGVDNSRKDSTQPCFGGFFIKQGAALPVEEIGCMRVPG
jgi:hypothetical protein